MNKILLLLSVLFVVSCSKDAEPIKYTLTTTVSPADSGTINPNGGTVDEGQQISVTAAPAAEYVFDKWTGAVSGSNKTLSLTMDSDKSVTANFVKKKYALTLSYNAFKGTITEKVIKTGAATDYNSGTVVELTAVPKTGWKLKEWSGDLTGTENPKQITIDKAKTVNAVFEALPPFYLDANGVTIKARDWVTVGTTGQVGGVTYTAVDNTTLKEIATQDQDVTKVVTTLVTDMKELFKNKGTFNQDISNWDVSNVIDMSKMFFQASVFNQDIGSWDVSKVTNMFGMFNRVTAFNQDIGSWDVSKVTNMKEMFLRAFIFNQSIENWDVSSVTNMNHMFSEASAFNKPIGNWSVGNVTDMKEMFHEALSFNQDIGNWDVSSVTDMFYMFGSANAFNQDIGSWDVTKITDMSGLFHSATLFNQNIGNWDVSNVTNMGNMFEGAKAFNQDIGSWDVSNVTDMTQMFSFASAFNQDVGRWEVGNVESGRMNALFNEANAFNQNLSGWCVTNISSEPSNFSTSSALTDANKPVWGTCPASGNSYAISVSAPSNASYSLDGKDRKGSVLGGDPGLTFKVGDVVTFSVSAAGHPFYLKTVAGTGTANEISGVTNNGTSSGSVVWKPSAAGTYYYQCSLHSGMVGTITIEN